MGLQENKNLSIRKDACTNTSFDSAYYERLTQNRYQRPDVLSETWQELLGTYPVETLAKSGEEVTSVTPMTVPAFTDDPWNQLLHIQGVEMIDLQQERLETAHVAFSDVEVEQALEVMWEQPAEENGRG
ncbi:MAG TPA: hypothetical protein DDW33_01390 [Ktedonobacter sp.]|jgi:hypothetical protein|nr:hypothetical protein [Ktedonobacter sp.]HAT44942.1 hypothetical protein [Ktedonobacter sp.]HBE24324.1 hypothetical protein [Ktedonobacter sp.]HBE27599.1 hypothetical protein [Ktedonobacter sp.]HCF85642.1 hypothetical protein [Ktedonobacter sp.]